MRLRLCGRTVLESSDLESNSSRELGPANVACAANAAASGFTRHPNAMYEKLIPNIIPPCHVLGSGSRRYHGNDRLLLCDFSYPCLCRSSGTLSDFRNAIYTICSTFQATLFIYSKNIFTGPPRGFPSLPPVERLPLRPPCKLRTIRANFLQCNLSRSFSKPPFRAPCRTFPSSRRAIGRARDRAARAGDATPSFPRARRADSSAPLPRAPGYPAWAR